MSKRIELQKIISWENEFFVWLVPYMNSESGCTLNGKFFSLFQEFWVRATERQKSDIYQTRNFPRLVKKSIHPDNESTFVILWDDATLEQRAYLFSTIMLPNYQSFVSAAANGQIVLIQRYLNFLENKKEEKETVYLTVGMQAIKAADEEKHTDVVMVIYSRATSDFRCFLFNHNKNHIQLFYQASEGGYVEVLYELWRYASIIQKHEMLDFNNFTPLLIAAREGHELVIRAWNIFAEEIESIPKLFGKMSRDKKLSEAFILAAVNCNVEAMDEIWHFTEKSSNVLELKKLLLDTIVSELRSTGGSTLRECIESGYIYVIEKFWFYAKELGYAAELVKRIESYLDKVFDTLIIRGDFDIVEDIIMFALEAGIDSIRINGEICRIFPESKREAMFEFVHQYNSSSDGVSYSASGDKKCEDELPVHDIEGDTRPLLGGVGEEDW